MTNTRTGRFELLDAFRGIAILAVVALHFAERGRDSHDAVIHARVWQFLQHGYLGVQLFFVISGYCITAAVVAASKKDQSLRYFVTRRLKRIFPPYWASILFVVVTGWGTAMFLGAKLDVLFPLQPWEWFANIFLLQGPLQATDANIVYWSLSIELQFYLVMAIALLFKPWFFDIWLVFIAMVSAILAYSHAIPLTGWVLNYWPEFACGIAAFFWITRSSNWLVTPWLLVSGAVTEMLISNCEHSRWILDDGRFIPGIRIAVCLLIMLAMIRLHSHDASLCTNAYVRWLIPIGTISYSIYLTHVPLGTRVFNLGQRITGLEGGWWIPYFFVAIIGTFVLGVLFFRWCEKPWMNTSKLSQLPSADNFAPATK